MTGISIILIQQLLEQIFKIEDLIFPIFLLLISTYITYSIPEMFQMDAPRMNYEFNRINTGTGTKYLVLSSDEVELKDLNSNNENKKIM